MTKFCRFCGERFSRPVTHCPKCGRPQTVKGLQSSQRVQNNPHLLIQQMGQPLYSHALTKPVTVIGREAGNDLILNTPIISRRHAQIEQRGQTYWIRDLGSTNGLSVDGQKAQEAQLGNGTVIRVGDAHGNSVKFEFRGSGQVAPPISRRLGTMRLGNQQKAVISIGREPTNDIHLDHPSVSRRHAEIRTSPTGAVLRDLRSANGTFVSGRQVRRPYPLQVGDVIQIGGFKIKYDPQQIQHFDSGKNYRIDAHNLVRDVDGGKKRILNDITLSIYPRDFVALVGGSGAGKSTLMKALSGLNRATGGSLLVNGDNLYENFGAYRNVLGYVPQDDIIHRQLTVKSALTYAARLRLPDATEHEIEQRIDKVIKDVELSNHRDTQVKALSGGQRKRVSIAAELLAEPGLFFLDEPTSGLDPGLEKKMMVDMKELADEGRTIVLVTHATANISQCTHVAFLGAGGRLAYFGPPHEAESYFGIGNGQMSHNAVGANFAEIYNRVSDEKPFNPAQLPAHIQTSHQQFARMNPGVAGSASEFWAYHYKKSPQHQQHVAARLQQGGVQSVNPIQTNKPSPAKQRADLLKQWSVLAQRYFELIWRDRLSLTILLAVMPIIGLLLLLMSDSHELVGLAQTDNGKTESCLVEEGEESTIFQKIQCNIERSKEEDGGDGPWMGIYEFVGQGERFLFVMALAPTLLGVFAASFEVTKEEAIYRRERLVNLKIVPYLLSKTTVLGAFSLVQCLLFLIVIRMKMDFPDDGVFMSPMVEMFITLLLGTVAAISLGLFISSAVKSSGTIIYIILLILFIQMLFSGAIFPVAPLSEPTPMTFISTLTSTRWTLEGLGATMDMNSLREKGGGCVESRTVLPDGREVEPTLDGVESDDYCKKEGQTKIPPNYKFDLMYTHKRGFLFMVWAVLLGFSVAFHGLAYVMLRRKDVV